MKLAHNIIAVLTIALGVFFLFNSASDIQLGFGVTLAAIGALALTKRA